MQIIEIYSRLFVFNFLKKEELFMLMDKIHRQVAWIFLKSIRFLTIIRANGLIQLHLRCDKNAEQEMRKEATPESILMLIWQLNYTAAEQRRKWLIF